MTIVLNIDPPRKGHDEYNSENYTNSFEPDRPWDGGEGDVPGEDFTGGMRSRVGLRCFPAQT
jgi:hypothetical protein